MVELYFTLRIIGAAVGIAAVAGSAVVLIIQHFK